MRSMRSIVRASKRGFTLIELMIVVAIVGILAVLAIYGVRKYLANAKTAEARNNLGELSRDLGVAFEREQSSAAAGAALSEGGSIAISHLLCDNPTGPLPAAIPAAQKVLVGTTDWNADQATANKGFACAKFVIDSPIYYRYNFITTQPTNGAGGVEQVTAEGDLNGDNVTSLFQMTNAVQAGKYTMAPSIAETNPEE
jgi:type IV pilus assembly protein PilA